METLYNMRSVKLHTGSHCVTGTQICNTLPYVIDALRKETVINFLQHNYETFVIGVQKTTSKTID